MRRASKRSMLRGNRGAESRRGRRMRQALSKGAEALTKRVIATVR